MMGQLLEQYKGLATSETLRLVRKLARRFEGRTFLHVYSGRLLPGVRDMLDRLGELFEDIGLRHQTAVLTGTEEFFDVVRAAEEGFSRKPKSEGLQSLMELYHETMRENASRIYLSADLVVVHGIQPMGLVVHRPDRHPWVWRSHGDLSQSTPGFDAFASMFLGEYQAALVPHASFVRELSLPTFVVPQSIDPFGDSNRHMAPGELKKTLQRLEVPVDRPLVLRFLSRGTPEEIREASDIWKGVRGSQHATLVLVYVGLGPPRVGRGSGAITRTIGGREDVHLVCVEHGACREMAALGWSAEVVVDPSTSPRPNRYVLDLLWKSKPVLLAEGSRTAMLVNECDAETYRTPEEQAWRLGSLLADKERARRLGESGRACVIKHYLPPQHVLEYLKLLLHLEGDAV